MFANGNVLAFDVNAANVTIRDLAAYGGADDIAVGNVAGTLIEGNVLGASAAGFADPGAATRTSASGVVVTAGDTGIVRNNLIGFHGRSGVLLGAGADGWLVEGNELRGNGQVDDFYDAVAIGAATGTTVRANLIAGNLSPGVDATGGAVGTTVVNNTISSNALGAGFEQFAVHFAAPGAGNVVDRNLINGTTGVGVLLDGGGTGAVTLVSNRITGNSNGGVLIGGSNNHVIGVAGQGNVISGNTGDGIRVQAASGVVIQANTIGLDATGTAVQANTSNGVFLDGATGNTIGGTAAGTGNLISGNAVDGISVTGWAAGLGNHVIAGNRIGTDATGTVDLGNARHGVYLWNTTSGNTVGGTVAAARNLVSGNDGSGVYIEGAGGNVVSGNYIGTEVTGGAALANAGAGVYLNAGASGNRIGGTLAGERNVISGNGAAGVLINGGSDNNVLQGNYIGTDAAGTAAVGNMLMGVYVGNSAGTTIGGAAAGERNVISGQAFNVGIELAGGGTTVAVVEGNYIGVDAGGVAALGNRSGVAVSGGAWNNRIGGTGAGQGNVIANSTVGAGVTTNGGGTGNIFSGNRIYANAGLGIDLEDNGVTPNDAGDADGGDNRRQNFPVLATANVVGPNITITGTLDSAVGGSFRLEFFASSAADPSGQGEGERYLGALTVTDGGMNDTDGIANGTIVFSTTLVPAQAVLGGEFVSATAIALATGDTSEFSANHVANTVPVNTVPATVTVNEDTAFAFTGANTISVADGQNNVTQVVLTVANGTLTAAGPGTVAGSGTASVTITGTQASINASLATLAYQGTLNYNGPDTLTVVSTDAGGMQDTDAAAITVVSVNDAPAGADNTVVTLEDTGYVFAAADFGFTDPADAPANALLAVTITTVPVTGSLTLSGVGVIAGQSISAAAIAAGNLVFTPAANQSGVGYASFTFQVQDNGGVAQRRDRPRPDAQHDDGRRHRGERRAGRDEQHRQAPSRTCAYVFATADFGFTDPSDAPANALLAVTITTVPGGRHAHPLRRRRHRRPVVSAAAIAAGNLVFTPVANANGAGYASFTFQVQDNGGTATGRRPRPDAQHDDDRRHRVNDAPAGTNNTVTTLEDIGYVFATADFGFTDPTDAPRERPPRGDDHHRSRRPARSPSPASASSPGSPSRPWPSPPATSSSPRSPTPERRRLRELHASRSRTTAAPPTAASTSTRPRTR